MTSRLLALLCVGLLLTAASASAGGGSAGHDAGYGAYADLLRAHVRDTGVDYASLTSRRAALDDVVETFAAVTADEEEAWPRADRLAFWINAYNVFTLQAIVDHYPIEGHSADAPRRSIRQIDGVWTRLRWKAAGRAVTLDHIEHVILRRELAEPLVHFALNCASASCPPLAVQPYRGATLDEQLQDAARRFLASPEGLQVEGTRVRVSSILDWFGSDFVRDFAGRAPGAGARDPSPNARAIRGLLATHGPERVHRLMADRRTRISFLPYDWSLNDASNRPDQP